MKNLLLNDILYQLRSRNKFEYNKKSVRNNKCDPYCFLRNFRLLDLVKVKSYLTYVTKGVKILFNIAKSGIHPEQMKIIICLFRDAIQIIFYFSVNFHARFTKESRIDNHFQNPFKEWKCPILLGLKPQLNLLEQDPEVQSPTFDTETSYEK